LWRESDDLTAIIRNLELMGYQDYVGYDPHIIRGLDYYTGTVFEARDMDGEYRAVLGGGRYDNLVGDVGGTPVGGVGFAMGDVVIGLVLEKYGCYPENIDQNPAKCLVTVFDEDSERTALRIAKLLRLSDLETAIYPEPAKLGKQFKYADRQGIRMTVVAGPDEVKEGKVTLKDLKTGEQFLVSESEMVPEIWKRLAEGESA
jgi:histidyl-tRNA synthetase